MRGPWPGQEVVLLVPDGDPVGARVESASDGLVLSILPGETASVMALRGARASVQFTNVRGVCRIDGTIGETARAERLPFSPEGRIKLIQRREHVRVTVLTPVHYEPHGPHGGTVVGSTTDVSGGGFVLAPPNDLRVGQRTRFTVELGDEEPVEFLGSVVRVDANWSAGVQIEDIVGRERERLIHWVFARERQSRRFLRGA